MDAALPVTRAPTDDPLSFEADDAVAVRVVAIGVVEDIGCDLLGHSCGEIPEALGVGERVVAVGPDVELAILVLHEESVRALAGEGEVIGPRLGRPRPTELGVALAFGEAPLVEDLDRLVG